MFRDNDFSSRFLTSQLIVSYFRKLNANICHNWLFEKIFPSRKRKTTFEEESRTSIVIYTNISTTFYITTKTLILVIHIAVVHYTNLKKNLNIEQNKIKMKIFNNKSAQRRFSIVFFLDTKKLNSIKYFVIYT